MTPPPTPLEARVIAIGGRFLFKIKRGRVQTAWSLAGAQLFGTWDGCARFDRARRALERQGRAFTVYTVSVDRFSGVA